MRERAIYSRAVYYPNPVPDSLASLTILGLVVDRLSVRAFIFLKLASI